MNDQRRLSVFLEKTSAVESFRHILPYPGELCRLNGKLRR